MIKVLARRERRGMNLQLMNLIMISSKGRRNMKPGKIQDDIKSEFKKGQFSVNECGVMHIGKRN